MADMNHTKPDCLAGFEFVPRGALLARDPG